MRSQIRVRKFRAEPPETLICLLENGDTVELVLCGYEVLTSLVVSSQLLLWRTLGHSQTAEVLE
jgi:hypothetical protein